MTKTSKARSKLRKVHSKKIKIREKKIIKEIRDNSGHSAYSLSKKMDIPLRTMQRSLKRLADKNIIIIINNNVGKRHRNILQLREVKS